ncbi:hypothetical protein BHE74_00039877 [Ensete ventricosum]|nr:hypothetical protein GW17_00052520 [Ensete ventricosum]RWW53627.1 hypothetical protein BHE74_00039877 [Ensete ventricosum]
MVSAECASSSTSVDGVAPDQVQFGISGASTSGGFPREPLELMAADEDLHRGLIGMGVPDSAQRYDASRGIDGACSDDRIGAPSGYLYLEC